MSRARRTGKEDSRPSSPRPAPRRVAIDSQSRVPRRCRLVRVDRRGWRPAWARDRAAGLDSGRAACFASCVGGARPRRDAAPERGDPAEQGPQTGDRR